MQSAGSVENLTADQLDSVYGEFTGVEVALFHLQDQIPYRSPDYPAVNQVYTDYVDAQGWVQDVEIAVTVSGAGDPNLAQDAQQLATMIGKVIADTSAARAVLGRA